MAYTVLMVCETHQNKQPIVILEQSMILEIVKQERKRNTVYLYFRSKHKSELYSSFMVCFQDILIRE